MKVVGLDGRPHVWSPRPRRAKSPSGLHLAARAFLREHFPLERLCEEVGLPGSGGLRADFFVPGPRLVVEAHGRQHYERVSHFHLDVAAYWRARERDGRKRLWCELNGLRLVELPHDDRGAWPLLLGP